MPCLRIEPLLLVVLAGSWSGCVVDIPDVLGGSGGEAGSTGDGASGGGPSDGGSASGGSDVGGSGGGVVLDPDLQTMCAGSDYSCAIHAGRVQCWGSSASMVAKGPAPAPVWDGPSDPVEPGTIACGEHHACVRSLDGHVYCWGSNTKNQLSFECADPFDPSPKAAPVELVSCSGGVPTPVGAVTSLSLAADSSCVTVDVDGGKLGCWGAELPAGTPLSQGYLEIGGLLAGANGVVLAADHGCVTTVDSVVCWGEFEDGQLGPDVTSGDPIVAMDGASPVQADGLSLAVGYSCALDDAALRCWGKPSPFLEGTTGNEPPTLVNPPASAIRRAATGSSHACAIDFEGDAVCWGSDARGALGDGGGVEPTPDFQPHLVIASTLSWVDIAVGESHTCARAADDRIFCWGANDSGQLGHVGGDADAPAEVLFP